MSHEPLFTPGGGWRLIGIVVVFGILVLVGSGMKHLLGKTYYDDPFCRRGHTYRCTQTVEAAGGFWNALGQTFGIGAR